MKKAKNSKNPMKKHISITNFPKLRTFVAISQKFGGE